MPILHRLLHRAYTLAERSNVNEVEIILKFIVEQDPNHIEAWEFLLNIFSRNRLKLEEIGACIKSSEQISHNTKQEVLEYFNYLIERINAHEQAVLKRAQFTRSMGWGLCGILAITILLLLHHDLQILILQLAAGAVFILGCSIAILSLDPKNKAGLPRNSRNMIQSYATDTQMSAIRIDQDMPTSNSPSLETKEGLQDHGFEGDDSMDDEEEIAALGSQDNPDY